MKFTPESTPTSGPLALDATLQTLLTEFRDQEGFDAAAYVESKTKRLLQYLTAYELKSCVVGVSGGVDSALVLAIAAHALKQPDSPLVEVVPVLLPVFDPKAATNQDVATARGKELCSVMGLNPVIIDLTSAHACTQGLVDAAMGEQGQEWAAGQLVSYQRTPALYYVTSLQTQKGRPGILLGTTNYDEGAYLGYFGKASDGLVDVQVISDLHKSQVFAAARHLGVPDSILDAVPTGDMFDGRVDETVFGATYDAVELFLRAKRHPYNRVARRIALDSEDTKSQFEAISQNLENLHRYNAHKYLGASPAVHLDLWDWSFTGSWKYHVWQRG